MLFEELIAEYVGQASFLQALQKARLGGAEGDRCILQMPLMGS